MRGDTIRERLRTWLREKMGLPQVDVTPVDPASKAPWFLMDSGTELVAAIVDGHHDMQADAFVLDPELGSVGVVHCLGLDAKVRDVDLSDWIEKAAYLRHLMGSRVDTHRVSGQSGAFVPSVELVFVVDAGASAALGLLRQTLRRFKEESALLHAIGINMAVVPEETGASAAEGFERGFAWLVRDIRAWFTAPANLVAGPSGAAGRGKVGAGWTKLVTRDFRVRGQRSWTRAQRPKPAESTDLPLLHVMHGPNGSGKSSLAEAFEFVVTGRSTRLRTEDQSPLVFRADVGVQPKMATVELRSGSETEIREVTLQSRQDSSGTNGNPNSGGSVLRFDQEVGDRLIRKDQKERMAYWLETYFPRHKKTWRAGAAARRARKRALDGLGCRDNLDDSTKPPEHWLKVKGLEFTRVIEGLLGLPKTWRELTDETEKGLRPTASSTPDDVNRLMMSILVAGAEMVRRAEPFLGDDFEDLLRRLGQVTFVDAPKSVVGRADYERNYRDWLDNVARADLLGSAWKMRRTFLGWSPPKSEVLSRFDVPVDLGEIATARKNAVEKRDDLRKWLASHSRSGAEPGRRSRRGAEAEDLPDPGLLLRSVEVGMFEGMLSAGAAGGLRRVFERRRAEDIQGFKVGYEPGWTKPLIEYRANLVTMRDWMLARGWKAGVDSQAWVSQLTGHVEALVSAIQELDQINQQDADRLQAMTPTLGPALMELVELLTPASWAYQRLDVEMDLKQDDVDAAGFGLRARGMELADVLNTAELNTVALAMHLLCAPLADNPHKVLFLDDPLQNMDELTVTTVARALAKLLRLLGQTGHGSLDFVLLLHGADDCERIIQEVPAAFYRIPWSSPAGIDEENGAEIGGLKINQDPSVGSVDGKLFDFVGFMGLGKS